MDDNRVSFFGSWQNSTGMFMNEQTAIDRILETENLTDGLEDDDANWLIDWGVERVRPLIAGIEDDEAAGEKVHQLMTVMRKLNQITADRQVKSAEDLAADVNMFLTAHAAAFGHAPTLGSGEVAFACVTIKMLPPLQAIQLLLGLAKPQDTSKPQENQAPPKPPNPRGPERTQD
jgi:hypothetical protein